MSPRRGTGLARPGTSAGLRDAWLRAKRRRAAKKFSVYMQKQGRDVHFDASGRYVEPEDGRGKPRDAKDRSWMN